MARTRTAAWLLIALFVLAPAAWAQDEPETAAPPPARPADVVPAPDLPGVIVTGTPLTAPRLQRSQAVPEVSLRTIGSRDVFQPERVRETGARDINDLVQHLPALSARPYNGGEAAAPSFSMRGLPDDGLTEYVNVLIDGVPASSLPYGWTAFSFLPITTDRVYALDYMRGAHSVRYSPNTVGGILNFITEPIPSCGRAHLRGTFGSFGYTSFLASVGGTGGRWGWMATVVDRRGDGYRDDGAFDQQDVNVKMRYDLGCGSWLAASLTWMESQHKAPGGLTLAQFEADRFANARPINEFEGERQVADVVLHVNQGAGNWWEAFSYLSRTWRHLRAQRPHFGAAATVSDWTDASWFFGAGARFERVVNAGGLCHTLYGGVRYQREWLPSWKLGSEPYPGGVRTPTMDARYETDTISLHLDDTFRPMPRLTVQVGARMEWIPSTDGSDRVGGWRFEDDFFRVLPGVGASYEVTPWSAVFANYFEGFRAPQVWGYADTTATGSLEFEKGRSMEAGYRWKHCRGLNGSVTAWRTVYDDFGVYDTGFYENLGRIEARGVDIVVGWDLGKKWRCLCGLSVDGSFTLQDSELKQGPNQGNETPYAWEQKATWRLRYERFGWHASIGGTYVGESFSDEANTVLENANGNLGLNPATTLWDARLAKQAVFWNGRARIEAAVGATNLFDTDWHVHSRGGFFGGGKVAGPPRQIYGSLDFTFNL